MAVTSFGVNHPLAVKVWSKRLNREVLKATWLYRFMGPSKDNVIQEKDELQKSAGDKVTFGLRMQLDGDGIIGDQILESNEEPLTIYNDAVYIDQLRHAVNAGGKMSQQRVPFSVREEAMDALRDWWSARIDESGFNQLCGYTPQTDIRRTGLQAVIAPDSNHIIRPVSGESADQSISTTSVFNLTMLDRAVERSGTMSPALRPVKVGGKEMYVAFLHNYQVTDLRTTTSTGQWLDIQKAAMSGGEIDDNPIFDGSLGVYNGVIMHRDTRVTNGVDGSSGAAVANVRRAVFLGAQAGVVAYGRDNGPERYTWVEKLFDYDNILGVSAGLIWGLKKTVFNGQDFGTIVMSSYAAQH